jgi:hypothetical protein
MLNKKSIPQVLILCTLLLVLIFMSCHSPRNIIGVYKSKGKFHTYELLLEEDSTFKYERYSLYGGIYSHGKWSNQNNNIILNSKPLIDTSGYGPKGIWVKVIHTEKLFVQDTFLFLHNKIIFRDKDFKDKKIIMKKRR